LKFGPEALLKLAPVTPLFEMIQKSGSPRFLIGQVGAFKSRNSSQPKTISEVIAIDDLGIDFLVQIFRSDVSKTTDV
jgi:hypothetical protein